MKKLINYIGFLIKKASCRISRHKYLGAFILGFAGVLLIYILGIGEYSISAVITVIIIGTPIGLLCCLLAYLISKLLYKKYSIVKVNRFTNTINAFWFIGTDIKSIVLSFKKDYQDILHDYDGKMIRTHTHGAFIREMVKLTFDQDAANAFREFDKSGKDSWSYSANGRSMSVTNRKCKKNANIASEITLKGYWNGGYERMKTKHHFYDVEVNL